MNRCLKNEAEYVRMAAHDAIESALPAKQASADMLEKTPLKPAK